MTIRGTTVILVRRGKKVAMASDGQVSLNDVIMKGTAKKIRRVGEGKALAGFAGSVADAFTLLERFDGKMKEHGGDIARSCVELAKDWRTSRALQRLEAMLLVADATRTFVLAGGGEVIEPDDEVTAIGSGGPYALAAAKALHAETKLSPAEVAKRALSIAASICVYTNAEIVVEEL